MPQRDKRNDTRREVRGIGIIMKKAKVQEYILQPFDKTLEYQQNCTYWEYNLLDNIMLGRQSVCFEVKEVVYQ